MKKRQIGILGIAIWQAVAILAKEKKLRDDIQATPGIFGKLKLLGEKRLHTNKTLINEVKNIDREQATNTLENDAKYDLENAQTWFEEQKNKDREAEGHQAVRTIKDNIPSEEKVKNTVETYTKKLKKWWDEQ